MKKRLSYKPNSKLSNYLNQSVPFGPTNVRWVKSMHVGPSKAMQAETAIAEALQRAEEKRQLKNLKRLIDRDDEED